MSKKRDVERVDLYKKDLGLKASWVQILENDSFLREIANKQYLRN